MNLTPCMLKMATISQLQHLQDCDREETLVKLWKQSSYWLFHMYECLKDHNKEAFVFFSSNYNKAVWPYHLRWILPSWAKVLNFWWLRLEAGALLSGFRRWKIVEREVIPPKKKFEPAYILMVIIILGLKKTQNLYN